MNIKLSSPKDTPKEDIMFAVEYPSVNRIKMRYQDVAKELVSIKNDIQNLNKRKKELTDIKKLMDVEING